MGDKLLVEYVTQGFSLDIIPPGQRPSWAGGSPKGLSYRLWLNSANHK